MINTNQGTKLMENKRIIFFVLLFSIFVNPVKAGEETVIPLDKVPAKLLVKAQELLPNARFKTANTEKEDNGDLIYEIQGILKDGRKLEVDLFENGEIQEFEVELSHDLVPGAVLQALEAKMPGFVPNYIEASHSASKKVIGYEFVGMQNGKKLDIDVSADGRKIELADQ